MLHIFILISCLFFLSKSVPVIKEAKNETTADKPPEFLLKMYSCIEFKNKGDFAAARNCSKFSGNTHLQNFIDKINIVWGFVGNWSDDISFEINTKTLHENIYVINLQLYKNSLTAREVQNINCDIKQLQLVVNETIISTINFNKTHLLTKRWISFDVHKEWYIKFLQKEGDDTSDNVNFHLKIVPVAVNGLCSTVSFSQLGFLDSPGYQPLLVVYSQTSDVAKELKYNLTENLEKVYNQDQSEITEENSKRSTSRTGYKLDPCALRTFNVPYSFIHTVPLQGHFALNYCAGHCNYPLSHKNLTNHANLVSYLNIPNLGFPDKPSPVCCSAIKYIPLGLLVRDPKEPSTFVMAEFDDVTVVECACR